MSDLNESLKVFNFQELLVGPLSELLSANSTYIWVWNISTNEMSWPAKSQGDSLGGAPTLEKFLLNVIPSDRVLVLSEFMNSVKENRNFQFDFRYILPDGSKGTARVNGSPILGTLGDIDALIGIVHDTTVETRKRDELAAVFESRDRIAQALETSIKPPILPTPPGFEVAAGYHSCEGESTGDFYDLFPLGAHDWGLIIGDVGGHGIEAAAITTAVRFSLKSAALVAKQPSKVMAAANETHFAATTEERFTTGHYVRIICENDSVKIKVATAGHPSLLIRRKNGTTKCVAGTGPMLGLMREAKFVHAQTTLEIGEMLIGFTDGLSESRNSEAMFGDLELEQFISSWNNPIKLFPESIYQRLIEFTDRGIRDDVAIIVLKRIA